MNDTKRLAINIRRGALQMVHHARASHIASALSIADILAVLYGRILRTFTAQPYAPERDRFILSKGHACTAVYAVLAELGFFPKEMLKNYGDDFSPLMNHISHKVPGVEFSTGSLGHGLPFGVGKALAARVRKEPWRVYVLLSDGEMDEGSNWEALMFAAHHKLDHLTAIIDCNGLQSLDTVTNTLELEPLLDKLTAFGCSACEIDGHDHRQIEAALSNPPHGKPLALIARTIKGKGVSFMENKVAWHYKNPNDEQLAAALAELAIENA